MNNYTSSRNKSQLNKRHIPELLLDQILQLESVIKALSPAMLKMLDYYIALDARYIQIDPSQKTVGERAGVRRQRSNVAAKLFHELKLVFKRGRYRNTCVYRIADLFHQPEVRKYLSYLLPSLQLCPLIYLLSCQSANSTLDYIKVFNISSPTPISLSINKDTAIRDKDLGDNFHKKGIKDMNAPGIGIPNYISDIKELDLTTYGRIRLMCFPEEAINHARSAIKLAYTPKNPFALFFKYCSTWCSENNIYPDYDLSKRIAISNKCSIDDKVLNSNKLLGDRPKVYSNPVEPKVMSSVERLHAQRAIATESASAIGVGVTSEIEQLKSEISKLQDKITNINTLGIPAFLLEDTKLRFMKDLEYSTNKLSQLC